MQIPKIKYKYAILFAVFIFLALIFTHSTYERYFIINPLQNKLASVTGIKNVQVIKEKNIINIKITYGNIENLRETEANIAETIAKVNKSDKIKLTFNDTRNQEQTKIWNKCKLIIYEGLQTGKYVEMQSRIDKLMTQNKVEKWTIDIDKNNLYIQIKNNANYLYEIISRS